MATAYKEKLPMWRVLTWRGFLPTWQLNDLHFFPLLLENFQAAQNFFCCPEISGQPKISSGQQREKTQISGQQRERN